jgi:hypothetical protein
MRNLSLPLTASLLAITAFAGTAVASDGKEYTGSSCLGSEGDNDFLLRTGSGRVLSTSPSELTVWCNAVKDGPGIESGSIWVIDTSAIEQVSCYLRSVQHDTTAVWQENDVTSVGGFNSSATQLTFGALPTEIEGGYLVLCHLPGVYNGQRSGVVTYRIVESD